MLRTTKDGKNAASVAASATLPKRRLESVTAVATISSSGRVTRVVAGSDAGFSGALFAQHGCSHGTKGTVGTPNGAATP